MLWLVVNIPSNDLNAGQVIFDYTNPCPGKKDGIYRLFFTLHEQRNDNKLNLNDLPFVHDRAGIPRLKFKIYEFMEKYELEPATRTNAYRTSYDDYVPIAMKEFLIGKPRNVSSWEEEEKILSKSNDD